MDAQTVVDRPKAGVMDAQTVVDRPKAGVMDAQIVVDTPKAGVMDAQTGVDRPKAGDPEFLRGTRRYSPVSATGAMVDKGSSEKFALAGKEGFFHFEGTVPGIVACDAGGPTQVMAFPDEPPGGIDDHFPFYS